MNKRKSPGECGEFFHTVLKECGAGQHFGLQSSVWECACACACVCVYTRDLTQQKSHANVCATSLGGALGWLFRGLTIVCRRQFFFVWKFTNHQWKCHRYGRNFGVKSLSPSVASVGWCWGWWGWWSWCLCRLCPAIIWGFLSLNRFQNYCKYFFLPRGKASLKPILFERLPTEAWWQQWKSILYASLFFSIYTQIN